MGRPPGCNCCSSDDGCYFGVIEGGTMEEADVDDYPSSGFIFGVNETNLNAAVHGPSGAGRITVFMVGMVKDFCFNVLLPSGTDWINACIEFLTSGGTILLIAENTQTGCVSVIDRGRINDFLDAIGSAMTINTGSVSIHTGNQLIQGPSATTSKVLPHPLTRNACNLAHGGAGEVIGGVPILVGDTGSGTGSAIASEDLYLDEDNPEVFGRVVFLADYNFFNTAVSQRLNKQFLDNMCGFWPCQISRWTASNQGYISSGIFNDGDSTTALTWSFNDATVNHAYSGPGKSAFGVALSSNTWRWDMNAGGRGGIESFCLDFGINVNIVTSTYVNGSGQFIAPKIGLCVLHDSGYYTTLDTPALTVQPAPTASNSLRQYSIGPVSPSDFKLITGWPGSGAAPAITASGADGVRYVRFGLAFQFEDADHGTITRFSIANATLKLDCNCA